ncbi:MAG: MBL fold metallo-hydrolase [bacterium]|nr:MBL fold metallo-hydrolase [bacterium]
MILKQYYLGCLAHASYLLGDEVTGTGVVVDPQRDVDQYMKDAAQYGLEVRHVFLTHFHADFLAGHLELRDRAGAQIHLGVQAKAEYAFVGMKDGQSLTFGKMRLQVLETPGHSPESISILVFDLGKDEQNPHAVLTGDTLFIGDVGRPDLRVSLGWTAEELGGMLYDSLHEKLLKLPDETLVYPTHGAGSMCGKNLSKDTVSTLGVQRQYNYALQPMDREEFIRIVTADQPDAPDYFTYDAILNTKEHPTLEQALERSLRPLALDEVLHLESEGAQLLDVRETAEFEGAYLAGCLNIGLDGRYATWAGTLLDPEVSVVIVAEPGREVEAETRLGRIGFDRIAGYLMGGMQALENRSDLVRHTERITAATLAEQLSSTTGPMVLDVSTNKEWGEKRIPGSVNIPLNRLKDRMAEVPNDRTVVVHCASGYRSSIAASLLALNGHEHTVSLVGGLSAWEVAGLETESGER